VLWTLNGPDMLLDGAITLGRLRELEPARDREIVFYCA